MFPLAGLLAVFTVVRGAVVSLSQTNLIHAALGEFCVGAAWACVAAAPFMGFHWAGALVDRQYHVVWRGTPARGSGLWARFHLVLAVVIFLAMGGHIWWIRAWLNGIGAIPLGGALPVELLRTIAFTMVTLVGDCLGLALIAAAAALFASFMVEAAAAILDRVNPVYSQRLQPPAIAPAVVTMVILFGLSLSVGELPGLYREALAAAEGLVHRVVP
jgi:type III secretory pathway component EscT